MYLQWKLNHILKQSQFLIDRDKIQIQVFSNSEQMHLLIVLDQDQLIKQVKQTKLVNQPQYQN